MAHALNDRLVWESSTNANSYQRGDASQRTNQSFGNHRVAVETETFPLLTTSTDSTGNTRENIENPARAVSLASVKNHTDRDQENQELDEENQLSSSSGINEIDPELGKLISQLCSHTRASEENKKQIILLTADLETLITLSVKDDRFDDEDTADFLHSAFNTIKVGLRLIIDNLHTPDFPEENIKYLYNLAKLQLTLYFTDLPYWPLSLMVFTLKESNQSRLDCNASENTKMTIDKMLTESSSDEAMSDERMSQLINELEGRITSFKESCKAGDNSHLLRLGVWLKAYKTTQTSVQPREPFTRYFNFSEEDIQKSIFPQLNSLCTLVVQPIRDFSSLLESLDKHGRTHSGNSNLYYLQAERWSVSVLESALSNNSSAEELTYVGDIISKLQALKQIAEGQTDGFIADSSVFMRTLFASKKPKDPIPGDLPSELLTTPLSQSFESWMYDGLFNFFYEIFDEPDVDIEQIDQIKTIRTQFESRVRQARTQRGNENTLEETIRTIQSISLSMENIRSCTSDTREQTLLNEVLRTSFKDTVREYFLGQQIDTSRTGSPIEELKSMFTGFETILEVKRNNHLFNMGHLKGGFLKNSRADNRQPVKEWQLKFIEAHLSSDQHSRFKKAQAKKNRSYPYFLERSPKNPSVLGAGMMKVDKGIGRMLGGKCYHKKHKVDESAKLGSTWPGSTGPEGTGSSCNVDLSDEDEGYSSDDGVDIDWTKGAGRTAHNFLHDNDANHAENGVLEENVGGLDNALPSPDVMKNWYVAFEKSTVKFFSRQPPEAEDKKEKLKVQQLQATNYLNYLANDKASIHQDYSNFLFKMLSLLRPANTPQSKINQFETVAKQAIDQYGKDQFALISSGETVQKEDDIEPLELPTEFCEGLSPFFKTIVREITSTDFRHDITADIYSVEILQQITGFLNMQVTVGSVTQEMYKHLDLCDTTFRTLENYFRRLASEFVEHKKDLLAERFFDMFSGASPLPVKHSSFLSALQNHHIHDFQADVENQLKKSNLSSEPPTTKAVMESIQQCYKDVLANLQKELMKSKIEKAIPFMRQGQNTTELSPAQYREMLQNKIQAGEALLKNLEATIKAFQLDDESLTPTDRWNGFSEWIENHEAGIMAVYCMGMGVSIYYLIQGKSHTPHHYRSGGQLPFGSYDAGMFSIDAAQVVTTAGAVITQFGQATGWKNDVRRMLELLKDADAFSFITTEPPSTLQSDMVNLFLSKYKPDDDPTTYDITCQNGSYHSGSNSTDTVRDVLASVSTRESPLQKSNSCIDRAFRIVGSMVTGGINGAALSAISTVTSAVCAPFCPSVAPVIDQPFQYMVGAGAAAGCLGGVTSGTKLDYFSRALNFSTRFFADDRTMGGMRAHVDQVVQCMVNRKNSTLARLLIENPFKAALNICGFSLPESFVKGTLHLVDGFIAQTEISDFAQWRKARQRLLSTAAAFNKAFDGKKLTQYDRHALINTLGEENVRTLLNDQTGRKAWSPDFQRFLAGVVNLLAYYIMLADLHFFLYEAVDKAKSYGGAVSTNSGTTEKSHTSPAPDSSDPTSPAVTQPSLTTSGDSSPGECPADTKRLPSAGKGWLECPVAIYEEFRKGAPLKRFFDVALFKTLPNLANFVDVKAHNAAWGKKSNDPAMVVTLKAGLAKNTVLGPAERLLQMSDSILLKCVGDVINQMNTNIKEAMESVGQRERDKASEALKKAAKDLFFRLLEKADYKLPKAESDMVDLISHWQENIGFKGLNALAAMRQLIAQDELKRCDTSQESFSEYKKTAMDRLATVMPSINDKSAVVPEDMRNNLERLKASVNQFIFDVNEGKDMFRAATPLLNILSSVDPKVVDYYVESRLYGPLFNKSSKRADAPPLMRVQHMYGQLATVA
ncbi:hypothetical protein [Endozoicomonas sp.]|uniref:hypothetical protein n=1 Tax=Endozoicomonas sp. TaxID=1892382 RepID=UPI0028884763|nr:hypothetical protein [Endozoicomonas sp.]